MFVRIASQRNVAELTTFLPFTQQDWHQTPIPSYSIPSYSIPSHPAALLKKHASSMSRFANVVSSVYQDGDHVWVHDYQLMQVPYELRKLHPNCRVAWFLHTPFPSSEIYRILPVRKQLLQVRRSRTAQHGQNAQGCSSGKLLECPRLVSLRCSVFCSGSGEQRYLCVIVGLWRVECPHCRPMSNFCFAGIGVFPPVTCLRNSAASFFHFYKRVNY